MLPNTFTPMPKMPRLTRGCTITEKIDGTNASVRIEEVELRDTFHGAGITIVLPHDGRLYQIRAGSRNRWITPEDDNYGFAKWVRDNAEELVKLGPGHHFGEWWGRGIQRGYGQSERWFSLFNAGRWINFEQDRFSDKQQVVPDCCSVVPVLARGPFNDTTVDKAIFTLLNNGSIAAPDFLNPEGIVIFHEASGMSFKKTLANDESPKGKA